MNSKNYMILFLLLLIMILSKNMSERFGPDVRCLGLSAPQNMTCGNMQHQGVPCVADNNDCIGNQQNLECWCKPKYKNI